MAKPQVASHRPPSHLPLVFTRRTWMRREHIAGAPPAGEGESELMMLVEKGEDKSVSYGVATDLIIAETAVQANKADNRPWIEHIRNEAAQDAKDDAKRIAAKKAAPARMESLDEKIERILAKVLPALFGGKKASA